DQVSFKKGNFMNALKMFRPRIEAWLRWHRHPNLGMFESASGVVAYPVAGAVIGAAIALAVCLNLALWWLLAPLVVLAALAGGALGDFRYWLVLAHDIVIERELATRLTVIRQAIETTHTIVLKHAPYLTSAIEQLDQMKAKQAGIDRLYFDEGVGAWV